MSDSPVIESSPSPEAQLKAFNQQLLHLQTQLAAESAQPADLADPIDIVGSVTQLRTHFLNQVLPLSAALPTQTPAFTEMNRHLRLLSVDTSFLQAAKQPATRQQRLSQIQGRLQQLLGFTQALLTNAAQSNDQTTES